MKKPLVWLGIGVGTLVICALLVTAGAAAGGLIGYLGSRYVASEAAPEPREALAPPSQIPSEPPERWWSWQWPTQPPELPRALASRLTPVLVTQVVPGSPAEDAGIEPQDIIIAVDGKALDAKHPLSALVRAHEPGDEIGLTILRTSHDTDVLQVEVTLDRNRDQQGEVVAYLGIWYEPFERRMFFAPPSGSTRD